jgi:PAS domain S-box-containing protein
MAELEENKALVRHYFEEIEAGNIDVIDEVFSETFTTGTDVVRSDIETSGRETLKAAWREFLDAFPDIETESQELIAEDDTVAFVQVWRGTHEGEFRGFAPTRNEVTHEMWGRYVFEDGEIVHGEAQVDNFSRFMQLGLELSIEGYRTLIDTAPDPIVIADVESGDVIETNEAAEQLIERSRDEIIGHPQHALHPNDKPYDEMFGDAASRARQRPVELSGFPDGTDVELRRADGSLVPVEINAQVVTLADVTTLVSIYRDVSSRRRRKQRLQVLNRILRHNLRNDLGIVEGLADTLAADLEGETAERAETIRSTARELVALGQKAREIERISSAESGLASPVSVHEVVDEIVADLTTEYPDADVVVDVPTDQRLVTTRTPLVLALENLLENALEHNTAPTPRALVDVEPTHNGLTVSIEDNGPGIPDLERAVLTEGAETPLEHSSGVGLWLTKWAVDAIRGELSVESTASGTRAVVSVPSLHPDTDSL